MRNYKDLHVWEKAHSLTLAVYKDTQRFPSEERFGLTSQIRRSCSSIPANLAEGRTLLSPPAVKRSWTTEDCGLCAVRLGAKQHHAHVVLIVAKAKECSGGVGFKPKAKSQEPRADLSNLLPPPHSC